MVTLLMQGPWLLPGGCLVMKESHLAAQWHTFLRRLAVGQLMLATKQNTKKNKQKLCCCCSCRQAVAAQAAQAAYFCLWRRPFWGRFIQVALLQGLHWCFCQWITPTRINASEQHLIEIIYHSSMAFCIILFALMLFVNVSGFKHCVGEWNEAEKLR